MAQKKPRIGGTRPRQDLLSRVDAIARNLWWSWNPDAQRLLAAIDPIEWQATNHNPILMLNELSEERAATLREDRAFHDLLESCERQLDHYLNARTWFARTASRQRKRLRAAYFCAEFALHESLPIYSGGLGVLAGDHLKSASDLGIPLVAVGLLYRCGYYRQELRPDGSTRPVYEHYDFADLPIYETGHTVGIPFGKRLVHAKVWQVDVGRVALYLLDTDIPANRSRDRQITRHLYGGDQQMRIEQEILLGVGGTRALRALGINPTVFHLNEGHAAFCILERLREMRVGGASLENAKRRVARSTVFTTHTPVPAGHDRFEPQLFLRYFRPRLEELGIHRDELLALGRENPDSHDEPFCMTILALRVSARRNGVAELHGQTSREMWTGVFNTDNPVDVPIGHITNGVHTETWLAPEIRPLYERYLKPRWVGASPHNNWWRRTDRIPAEELWRIRALLRRKLVEFTRARLREQIQRRAGDVRELVAALDTFDEDALTIGFARRFATYKRAPLIFHNRKRLAAILNDAQRPVQLVFAGKAHPADQPGQAYVQHVYEMAKRAGFRGHVAFIENYDMQVGRLLTSGCDIWLNNPIPPQEASGTSGMKPPLHGGLNCSVLDGWWPEAYDGHNGWAIHSAQDARSDAARDRLDAEAIYHAFESEIVPLFYRRDRDGIPRKWIRHMLASMKTVCGQFNTHRMLAEYLELYSPDK